ncbi:MAG: hypothetical protein LBN93_06770 [Candidatus Symbiothrix sp.]|jgi:hypothetical protein|nr:hypothetical protein [Candidatus Symbiothrix sp.]
MKVTINRAKAHSLMSKVFCSMMIAIAIVSFESCDSPKSKGEKLGQEYCECQKEYVEAQEKAYQEFLAKFDSYSFKTRSDARQKWQDLQDETTRKFEERKGQIEDKIKKAQSEFPTDVSNLLDPKILQKYAKNPQKYLKEFEKNQKKASEFNDGLRNAANQCVESPIIPDYSAIDKKIATITPAQPDVQSLKNGLQGRRITEPANGYFGQGWSWQINSPEEIKEVKIEKAEKSGDDYALDVHLILQRGESAKYEANVKIICVLKPENDDWTVDFIETKDIQIAKTGRYDNCITTEQTKNWGSTYLTFTNSCDVNLIIGGEITSDGVEWTKFSQSVSANNTGSHSVGNIKEYRINFIERW